VRSVRVGLAGLLGVALVSGRAHANWPKEVTLAVTPAYAVAFVDSRTAQGGGFALDAGFGVSDTVSLHVTSALTWMHAPAVVPAMGSMMKAVPAGTISGFLAMGGVNYTLDVIRLVPSFDLDVGVIGLRGGAQFSSSAQASQVLSPLTAFGLGLGFQLDYLVTRHLYVGAEVRYNIALTDINRLPTYLYAGPRVTVRFGR
jgi:hypothetical protein